MLNFQTPGVYLREVESAQPAPLRLSVTGLVGQAERGPTDSPQLLTSWGQFTEIFGGFTGYSYLAYAVFGFFLNGGERCYVVRVTNDDARAAKLTEQMFDISAINLGSWGNDVSVEIAGPSSGEMLLTTLKADFVGSAPASFNSVAGLAVGDKLTLIHPRNPQRQGFTVQSVDAGKGEVTFASSSHPFFPAGSGVLGRGFKLVFKLTPAGQRVREEVFDNLSLEPTHERYFVRVINGEPEEKDYAKRLRNGNSILVRVVDRCAKGEATCSRPQSKISLSLEKGADDPSKVEVRHLTGYDDGVYFRPVPPGADAETVRQIEQRYFGLAAFEQVSEVGLAAMPDLIVPDLFAEIPQEKISREGIIFSPLPDGLLAFRNLKTGQRDLLRHCEKLGDRFALLDAPRGAQTGKGVNRIEDWVSNFQLLPETKFGALYYPWLREKKADFSGRDLFIPPSGHLAGVYARTERERGIGQAPANELLHGVVEFECCVTDAQQALLNPLSVNCLRALPGRGLRVWGARTLSSDPLWRYVNVRRLCLAIIKQINLNLQWTVFEPNDQRLYNRIVATLRLFLNDLFRRGALAGATPEEAFFVKCDAETNPPEVVERGEVITEIGFAPARPAEFILVTIKRTTDAVSVKEQAG